MNLTVQQVDALIFLLFMVAMLLFSAFVIKMLK